MENFKINEFVFRIRKMNAIELFALRTVLSFDDYDNCMQSVNLALENLEVQLNDTWLPVKEKNSNVYYPKKVEEDPTIVGDLFTKFLTYIKSVFPKSGASN